MDKAKKDTVMMVVAVIITFIIGVSMFFAIDFALYSDAIEDCRSDIQGMNVSDDYRRGWNDCLDRIEEYRDRVENVTSNISEMMD